MSAFATRALFPGHTSSMTKRIALSCNKAARSALAASIVAFVLIVGSSWLTQSLTIAIASSGSLPRVIHTRPSRKRASMSGRQTIQRATVVLPTPPSPCTALMIVRPLSLRLTRSSAVGNTQSLNGAPLRRAPGLRARTGT